MSIILRDYQLEAIEAIWSDLFENDSALCVLPTGTGKTEIMIELLSRSISKKSDLRAIVLVNKITLLDQTARRFEKHVPGKVGIYNGTKGEYRLDTPLTVATIQSIYSIPIEKLNLIILDEVHNVDQESGRYFDFIEINKKLNPRLKIIAFTATPFRASGYIYGENKLFKSISYQKKLPEMIERGYLVPPRMKRVEHQLDTSQLRVRMGEFHQKDVDELVRDRVKIKCQVQDAISRMSEKNQIVWACANIQHCIDVFFELRQEGEDAVTLHSKMSDSFRETAMHEFESGKARHMVFVSIVSEGYDHPPIDCIVLMRPIRSPVLYVQTVGRGLRPFPGKTDLLVLDYGRVVETVGPLDNPLMIKQKKQLEIKMKFCPNCLEYVDSRAMNCPVCQYVFISPPKDPTKNLTEIACDDGDLLSFPARRNVYKVSSVSMNEHMSKNGNDCLKIVYYFDILNRIEEYFVWDNDYARKRLSKRLLEFGCEFKSSLSDQVGCEIKNKPTSITWIKDGNFKKIIEINYD